MPIGESSTRVLMIDDEPEYLDWVIEYLEAQKLSADVVTDLPRALQAIDGGPYRLILIDMNIPALGAIQSLSRNYGPVAHEYPGIIAAVRARSKGYGAHQVVAYTVHDDDGADAELMKLNCRYVLKGRPEVLKALIQAAIRPKPFRYTEKGEKISIEHEKQTPRRRSK